jgi:tripartite ATP-independent transporter DctM subunit
LIALLSLAFLGLITVGVPIVFAMLASMVIAIGFGSSFPLAFVSQHLGTGIETFSFLAIPMFVLAGSIMEETGISLRLANLARGLVGHVPGGLAHAVVVTDIFFSGLSGSTLADASAVASLTYPNLRDSGYTRGRATAIIVAAAAIGVLFPPCLTMVIIGSLLGISITSLFLSGLLPGLLMAFALMVLIYFQARRGILPGVELQFSWWRLWVEFRSSLIALLMPVILFGGIFGGVFTPTEAAAVAVAYALIVGLLLGQLTPAKIYAIFERTAVTTGAIGLLIGASSGVSALLSLSGEPVILVGLINDFTRQPLVFLIISNIIFMIFGALLDGVPALLLFLPMLMPTSKSLGIDPLHFALTAIASLGVGVIIPPVGIMLLVVCSITKASIGEVARVMAPYFAILCFCLLLIMAFPSFVLFLPRTLGY